MTRKATTVWLVLNAQQVLDVLEIMRNYGLFVPGENGEEVVRVQIGIEYLEGEDVSRHAGG